MDKFYNENIYETIQQPDFFSQKDLEHVKSVYYKLYYDVEKICNFDLANSFMRIEEANFKNYGKNKIQTAQIEVKKRDNNTKKITERFTIKEDTQDSSLIVEKYNDMLCNIKKLLEENFTKIGRPAKVIDLAFHNFSSALPIHCDGQDIGANLKRATKRPRNHPNYLKSQYQPVGFGIPKKYAHQGLINLDARADKATVVFDQWFPYSTYYDITNTVDTLDEIKRPVTSFSKEDKGNFNRFDEYIRNLTGKPFPLDDYLQIAGEIDIDTFKQIYPIEKLHGLSLSKVCYFGTPGTLISWDNKRYHMAKPFSVEGDRGIGNQNRLMLQYETWFVN